MSHDPAPKTGWQTLAELTLLVGTDLESQVQAWMLDTMRILGLSPELLNRILKSALEAISRIAHPNSKEVNSPLVRLRAYAPSEAPIKSGSSRNWGFFRIEKHGFISTGSGYFDHLIEFYLYLEG